MKKILLIFITLILLVVPNLSIAWDREMWGGVTVTNTGTGNTAVFNDEAGDTTPTVIDEDGNLVLGGSLEISNGVAPTVDAAGEIAVDTTDDQLVYYGAAKRILSYKRPHCKFLESLAAADDDIPIAMFNFPVTITNLGIHCKGTCSTPAEISLEDRTGNAMTHTTPTVSIGTGNTTYVAVTAANQLVAGEGLRFDVDNAVSPETDTYSICFEYTIDSQ